MVCALVTMFWFFWLSPSPARPPLSMVAGEVCISRHIKCDGVITKQKIKLTVSFSVSLCSRIPLNYSTPICTPALIGVMRYSVFAFYLPQWEFV